jgi:hypothetical protein
MNTVRLNGEIVSEIHFSTNVKKQCPQVDFLLEAPFHHPFKQLDEDYHARLRTYVFGDEAEWINENLHEGSHIEIRKGFVQTWFSPIQKKSFYRIVGYDIDRVGCMQVAPFNEEWNEGKFAGFFRKQFSSGEYEGVKQIGISIKALPDMKYYGSSYAPFLSAWVYGEDAERLDGNVWPDRPLDLLEGTLQTFRNEGNKTWGLYIITKKIEF